MDRRSKIVLMWLVLMIGFCVHTLLEWLPLSFGGNVALPDATGEVPKFMYAFAGGIMFLLPVCGIMIAMYARSKVWVICGVILSILMLLMNILHMRDLADASIGQFFVLPLNLLISLLLVIEEFKLSKHKEFS